ncbi:MAG: hypothetical protein LCH46_08315 [Proteobacteria bacterium]|nr:hypothetical protein [Pseudomonadota bacterium]
MKKGSILIAMAMGLAVVGFACGQAFAANKTFNDPKIQGKRLDWCRVWGEQCGAPAAQAYCWYRDMGKVVSFAQDPDPDGPTQVIKTGEVCDGGNCASFKKIVCASKEGEATNFDEDDGGVAQQGGDGNPPPDQQAAPAAKEQNLGGQVTGDLSVSQVWKPNGYRIALFARGTNGALWWRPGSGSGPWAANWEQVGGVMKYSPSCTSFQKRIHCFVVGQDDALWTTSQDKDGNWYPFKSLGGFVNASPSAVAAKDGNGSDALYVFVRTTNNALSVRAYLKDQDTELFGWADYRGLKKTLWSAPSCTFMGGDHVDCYMRKENGNTIELPEVLKGGSALDLGGQTEKRPSVIVGATQKLVRVLVKGTDGVLWHRTWKSETGFADWKSTGIPLDGQPQCSYVADSKLYWCFDILADKSVRARRFAASPFN